MITLNNLEYLKNYPVFGVKALRKKISNRYKNLYFHRLWKKGLIIRVEKNVYTLYKDPFLIASRIVWPSYISCWSGLDYHHLTEQVAYDIFVVTPRYKKPIVFQNTTINFILTKSKNMFGYEKIEYKGFEIFVADKEKSIIDSALFKRVSFSEISEIIKDNIKVLDIKKFLSYLRQIGNKSLIRRFGYLFDKLGKDYHSQLRKYIGREYTPLDYFRGKKGTKNNKWRIIKNA